MRTWLSDETVALALPLPLSAVADALSDIGEDVADDVAAAVTDVEGASLSTATLLDKDVLDAAEETAFSSDAEFTESLDDASVVAAETVEFFAPGVPPGNTLVCHPIPSASRSSVCFVVLFPAGHPPDASR
jgi:hypothetical protein